MRLTPEVDYEHLHWHFFSLVKMLTPNKDADEIEICFLSQNIIWALLFNHGKNWTCNSTP